MTRYKYLKNASIDEMADFLCSMTSNMGTERDEQDMCDLCIASDVCSYDHNGFLDWLNGEWKSEYSENR